MAGADQGVVIFNRNQQSEVETDVWDDTALISAYDNAVSVMKTQMTDRNEDENPDDQKMTEAEKIMKKKKKKKSRSKKKKQKWNLGDFCRAVFSEDGLLYTGQIISIDYESGTCVVKYKNYGNEEEHDLNDIKHPSVKIKRTRRHSSASESENVDGAGQSASQGRSPKHPGAGAANHNTGRQGMGFHRMPQHTHGMPQATPFPSFRTAPRTPMMPPPPPPPQMMEDSCDDENEALSSMLIAWYMSGYHTGYYQGLRQGRHHVGGATSSVPR